MTLKINSFLTDSGINVIVNDKTFPINYPGEIWNKTDITLKKILLDNLSLVSTLYLPQILNERECLYNTSRPLSESFALRSGIYDAPYCANVDGKSSIKYLRDFFNVQFKFQDECIKTHPIINLKDRTPLKRALILFSFGKESLLSYAICKELGIEPILVTIIHPGFKHEWTQKEPLVKKFEEEFNETVYRIDYQAGLLKEGLVFGESTELGWGLHVTEYALLSLPFCDLFDADVVVCGNEQSCNDTYFDTEDVLIYRAGIDQHRDWTSQQGLLQSLLLGRSLPAISLVEPLYEILETKILHQRYPKIGKYQMSCFASKDSAKSSRWCEQCDKCAYMYTLFKAFSIDTASLGFKSDLFDADHAYLFNNFFSRDDNTHFYGSQGELGLAMYLAFQDATQSSATSSKLDKNKSFVLNKFEKLLLPYFETNYQAISAKYLGIHQTKNIPAEIFDKVVSVFLESCI